MLHRLRVALKPLVPASLRGTVKRAVLWASSLALRGDTVECSCCGRTYRRFLEYPARFCPACGSYERQRLMCLVFDRRPELLAERRSALHVGPEPCIRSRLEREGIDDYLSIDLDPQIAMRVMDVTALDLPDGRFDLVLCSHVLDVVGDPQLALREIGRVLAPGGLALFQTPVQAQDELEELLAEAGYAVEAVTAGDLGRKVVERHGLIPAERLYLARMSAVAGASGERLERPRER